MKKLALFLAVLLLLTACTPAAPAAVTETPSADADASSTEVSTEALTEAPTETPTEAIPTTESRAEDFSVLETALSFVDKSVDELKAVLGEPDIAYYEESCIGEGDDGILYYDDITVFTFRPADGSDEIVVDAELNE